MFEKKDDIQRENTSNDFEMVLLKTASNNYELDLMKNLLDEHNISYILKDRGMGGYMRIIGGYSLYGTDILVERSSFEKAKEILDEFPWDD